MNFFQIHGVPQEIDIAKTFIMMCSGKSAELSRINPTVFRFFLLLYNPSAAESLDSDMLHRLDNGSPGNWDLGSFATLVVDIANYAKGRIDWNSIIRHLDCPELPSFIGGVFFSIISRLYAVGNEGSRLPISLLLEDWVYRESQIFFLSAALTNPELIDWNSTPPFPNSGQQDWDSPYCRVRLMNTLIVLDAPKLFSPAVTLKPDLVLLTLACSQPKSNSKLQSRIIVTLLASQIAAFPSSKRTLKLMWEIAPALLCGGLIAGWRKDPSTLSQVVDIALDGQRFHELLGASMPLEFVFAVAMFSYRRHRVRLEDMLNNYFLSNPPEMLSAFLRHMSGILSNPGTAGDIFSFPVDGLRISFRSVFNVLSGAKLEIERTQLTKISDEFKYVHEAYVRRDIRLSDLDPSEDVGDHSVLVGADRNHPEQRPSPLESQFSTDIEEQVNVHFHEMYKEALSVEDSVEMLNNLRNSEVERDRKVFDCIIHTLFDEYRFFKNYPIKELKITGMLFGSLIKFSLFESGRTMETALECVRDSLIQGGVDGTHPTGPLNECDEDQNRMLKFGLCALEKFQSRLREWPQFCLRIYRMAHLHAIAPDMISYIRDILASSNTADNTQVPASSAFAPATAEVTVPNTVVAEKVSFVCNNLTATTIKEKGNILKTFLPADHFSYFIDHIVKKRALLEPNHHQSYVALLETLVSYIPKLFNRVLEKSLITAKSMLMSEKITFSNEERRMLRTLGAWIGLITLGRNKPILSRNLDLKKLCLDAYTKGRLFCVVPFVCKVLLGAKASKVFRSTNPWMKAIFSLLKEISQIEDLKLNVKFELPSLLGQLDVDGNTVLPSNILSKVPGPNLRNNLDRRKSPQASPRSAVGSPDGQTIPPKYDEYAVDTREPMMEPSTMLVGGSSSGYGNKPRNETPLNAIGTNSISRIQNSSFSRTKAQEQASSESSLMSSFSHVVREKMKCTMFENVPNMKAMLPLALEHALRDIIQPVVERSCAIASLTTRELTLKDFANEKNASKVRTAALQMVQQLAGSLALVTCKEPLRVSIGNHVRSILTSAIISADPAVIDQAAQSICNENLDLGCRIIEKAAKDKAAHDLRDVAVNPGAHAKPNQSRAYSNDSIPGSEVFRVYSDFDGLLGPSLLDSAPRPDPILASPVRNNQHSQISRQVDKSSSPGRPFLRSFDKRTAPEVRDQGFGNVYHAAGQNGVPMASAGVMDSSVLSLKEANPDTLSPFGARGLHEQLPSTSQVLERFSLLYGQLITSINDVYSVDFSLSDVFSDHVIHRLLSKILVYIQKLVVNDDTSIAVAQKLFNNFYENGNSSIHRQVHVKLLESVRENCERLSKELVVWIAFSDDYKKFNKECTMEILRSHCLISLSSYDDFLSKVLDSGKNLRALDFATFVLRRAVIEEKVVTSSELVLTLEKLERIGRRTDLPDLPAAPRGLPVLVAAVRQSNTVLFRSSPVRAGDQRVSNSGEEEDLDNSAAREVVSSILVEWQRHLTTGAQHNIISTFVGHIRSKTLSTEQSRNEFCRLAVEIIVSVTLSTLKSKDSIQSGSNQLAGTPLTAVSSAVRLFGALCFSESAQGKDTRNRSLRILASLLSALAKSVVTISHFEQVRPHYELFLGIMIEASKDSSAKEAAQNTDALARLDNQAANRTDLLRPWSRSQSMSFLDGRADGLINFVRMNSNSPDIYHAFLGLIVGALKACAPRAAPSFSYCWLMLISNETLLGPLLKSSDLSSRDLFVQLIGSLLAFLGPHTQKGAKLTNDIKHLYKGTLRILLLLLHDFPMFLCEYSAILCNAIPSNCIQLRNIVLAAYPQNMRLPDPFSPDLVVSNLPEMGAIPPVLSGVSMAVQDNIQRAVDLAMNLAARGSVIEASNVLPCVMHVGNGGATLNVAALNEVVLYCGQSASRNGMASKEVPTAVLTCLLNALDSQGQYNLVNAIANQLRYPNSHTNYFSSALLQLFRQSQNVDMKELITRVLVERLIANRPHPWGLLVTFIHLIKNPIYNFWHYPFVRCAPQIENLFENVAQFCIGPHAEIGPIIPGEAPVEAQ